MIDQPGWCNWCPSPAYLADGRVALAFSRWPARDGFENWASKSEIALAVSTNGPLGPYAFVGTILAGSGRDGDFDRDVTHNPCLFLDGGKFYLYYMGTNSGDDHNRTSTQVGSAAWKHCRSHQLVGVAVAERIEGPYRRSGKPLFALDDDMVTMSNPAICRMPNGKYLLIVKWGEKDRIPRTWPKCRVNHFAAIGDTPLGPFKIARREIFAVNCVNFPGEDPYLWTEGDTICCAIHDMGTFYSNEDRALIRFESKDGVTWRNKGVLFPRGRVSRLERPAILCGKDGSRLLFAASKPSGASPNSMIVAYPGVVPEPLRATPLPRIRRSLLVHPDEFTDAWIDRAAALGLDTLAMHPVGGGGADKTLAALLKDLEKPAFRARIDRAKAKGLDVAYEMHAASWLLPRDLFATHPEYFREDNSGRRCQRTNFCVSNGEALDIVAHRAVELAHRLYGSSHRYFFWLDDVNGGRCCCATCCSLSESDQQLVYANRVVTELRKTIPDATFAYLAYYATMAPPKKVRPAEGVFLEYAPYCRNMKRALAEQVETQLDPLEPLFAVFGRRDARVLEYWFDNSLFSHYRKPPKRLDPPSSVVRSDIAAYRARGFVDLASFACYLGDDYERLWGPPDCSSFRRGFHGATGGRDETDFTWRIAEGRFRFAFAIDDATPSVVDKVSTKRDLERGDRAEIFISPTADMSRWYYCAEIDPRGRVLDYRITFPRRFDYAWSFRTLERRTQRTARGYRVEGSIALDELAELGIDPCDCWLGAFRADYDAKAGRIADWFSFVPPGPGEADFHRPCMLFHAQSPR